MKPQFSANFNWKLHTFTLFQTCLPCQIKLYFVNIQSNQNLTSWSYSILNKPNQIRHNPSRTNNTIYRIQIVNSIIISYFNTFNISSSVKGKHLPQQNFSGALWCTIAAIQTAHLPCRFTKFPALTSLYLLFELIFNIANLFLRHFYFKEKQNRLIAKNTLSKNPKWYFMIFFPPAGARSKSIHFN